jgi:hypothetical protein
MYWRCIGDILFKQQVYSFCILYFVFFFVTLPPNINYSRFYDESKEPKYDDCNSMLYDDERGV